jgi:secondary thiamine-phosphate synthase enzyme
LPLKPSAPVIQRKAAGNRAEKEEGDMNLTVKTRERTHLVDITHEVQSAIRSAGIEKGILMIYCPHTTGAITINESADPAVRADIVKALNHIVPWELGYRHMEGNSPAHVKSSLVGASELVAVENGQLVLGTWQGIFFCEFDGPRTRNVQLRLMEGK